MKNRLVPITNKLLIELLLGESCVSDYTFEMEGVKNNSNGNTNTNKPNVTIMEIVNINIMQNIISLFEDSTGIYSGLVGNWYMEITGVV